MSILLGLTPQGLEFVFGPSLGSGGEYSTRFDPTGTWSLYSGRPWGQGVSILLGLTPQGLEFVFGSSLGSGGAYSTRFDPTGTGVCIRAEPGVRG